MQVKLESNVRAYCRSFPDVFDTAEGASVTSVKGRRYVDFLSGCGSLNYGHSHPSLREALSSYISHNGIVMSLDMETRSKNEFMEVFSRHILQPRGLDYRFQFPGPTGANAVEAAVKLARKFTGRSSIVAFTNAFHGCSLGALALTGNRHHRNNSEALLTNVMRAPYDGYYGPDVDTSACIEKLFVDPSSGYDLPAAIVIETVQGEGGLNVASIEWMQKIARLAQKNHTLFIVDDIQAGCGRSGNFFSFESLDVYPDIVCLAKSISGFGLPMSLVLLRPEYDVWSPGEHSGTFRGNNLAFVTATEAIRQFWTSDAFCNGVHDRTVKVSKFLSGLSNTYPNDIGVKGRGMMMGLEFSDPELPKSIQEQCFSRGLIIELCGPNDEVLKLLPPLNIADDELDKGLDIIATVVCDNLKRANSIISGVKHG